MYLTLTTRCNMTCAHCCMSATRKGDDMSREVFIKALELASEYGMYLTLGGGEPTIHPEFFEYLDKAMEYTRLGVEGPIFVITNGKVKRTAERLLRLVEDERDLPLHVELSQDEWHDPIHPDVVAKFSRYQKLRMNHRWSTGPFPKAGIRTVTSIVPVGRAADPVRGIQLNSLGIKCCRNAPLVDPFGTIWSCGCKIHKLGTVWDGDALAGYDAEYAHEGGALLECDEAMAHTA